MVLTAAQTTAFFKGNDQMEIPHATILCSNTRQKRVKFKLSASRLHTVLDMRPSTTNNPTSYQDPKFVDMDTILETKITFQDRQQAQTPIDTITGLLHTHLVGQEHHAQAIIPI